MSKTTILWVDDEIDLLKPHVLFLEQKGYELNTATNGTDAINMVKENTYDLIFLDENMPGITGIETLSIIKRINSSIPVVMITKSEEENIMEDAIGANIADYLIKPVNPNQILLTIKKNIDKKRLVTEKTTHAYQTAFGRLGMEINDSLTFSDWKKIYKKLIYWEIELENSSDNTMNEVLKMQKHEANLSFAKFIKNNYVSWFHSDDKPEMSHTLFKNNVFPLLEENKVVVLVVDNLRFDQWKIIQTEISDYFNIDDDIFYSILPTATQYARNSIFAGLMPSEINKLYPDIWLNDEEDGNKNDHEEELLKLQLKRQGLDKKVYYDKIFNNKQGQKIVDNLSQILDNDLITIVYNFIDILSHARTEMQMVKELAINDSAYRSITKSWFEHSSLKTLLKRLSEEDIKVVITTDHGTVKVNNAIKVVGDRNTTTNLRYKQGRNLSYKQKEVFEIQNPEEAYLPKTNMSSRYIFAQNDDFFAYPNNYNHYAKYYKNTYQHGGVSLEEVLIPIVVLTPKR
jgi:CheY-like chemotaxis protein